MAVDITSTVQRYLYFILRSCSWVFGWLFLNLLYLTMPASYRQMGLTLGQHCRANLVLSDPDDYINSFRTYQALKGRLLWFLHELKCTARLNHPAPNTKLIYNDTERQILDFQHEDRPLVVAFGSLTSPAFMGHLEKLRKLIHDFRHTTDFLVVYCREAHAKDAWGFRNAPWPIPNHRGSKDRRELASELRVSLLTGSSSPPLVPPLPSASFRVVRDAYGTEDSCWAYGAMPCRLYVLNNGRVAMAGNPGPNGYDIGQVADWLHKHQC